MALRSEPENVLDMIAELQRQVRDLQTARSAGHTTINRGATTVADDNGVVQARIGLLSDGSYGIELRRVDGSFGKLSAG